MTANGSWLTGFRLLVVLALFTLTGGSALAFQGDLKEPDEGGEEDAEFPGLIDEGEYVSPQFDLEITWTDAWAVGDESDPYVEHANGGNYDGSVASDRALGDIVFLMDTESETSVLSLGFSPLEAPIDSEEMLDAMADPAFLEDNLFLSADAEVMLLDSTDDTVAILVREVAPNDDHVVYMEIVTDPGREDFGFWAGLDMYEPEEYERILTSIDQDIEVEDNEVFDVFGVDEMLEALESEPAEPTETTEATEEPTETAEATETATEEATEAATEEPTEEATEDTIIPPFQQTETPIATEEATTQATPEASEEATGTAEASPAASPVASPESGADELPGLAAPGEYTSPQHDVPVTWTDAWTLDPDTDPAVQSFPESGVDAIYLTDADSESAIVYITVENATGPFDPDATLSAVSDPGYIESTLQLSPETEVVMTATRDDAIAVMYVDSSGDAPFVSILEAHMVDDDTIVFIELRATAAEIDDALLDSVEDEIAVDGEDALDIFPAREVIEALP